MFSAALALFFCLARILVLLPLTRVPGYLLILPSINPCLSSVIPCSVPLWPLESHFNLLPQYGPFDY